MATLRGHAISTLFGQADHTYVTCAGGYAWGCWGRSTGGKIICTGSGSSAQANCISLPSSTAGLIYGVTGVCHQTANRILWPAGITVRKAKGYWASVLAYGTYGSDVPAWLIRIGVCSTSTGEIPKCSAKGRTALSISAREAPPDAKDRALLRDIKALYLRGVSTQEHKRRILMKGPADLKTLGSETKLVLQHRLGKAIKAADIKDIQTIQMELFSKQAQIAMHLHEGGLNGESLAQKINGAVNKMLKDCYKSLGKENYTKLLELEPGEMINIVDPEIAVKVYK
ncbi:MAG: hypothetical protein IV108_03000 [Burkholderiales bacterium]|nr:hypothetical protein [Burkholderiales bacterium]